MADPKSTNSAIPGDGNGRDVEASVHRLDRGLSTGNERPASVEGKAPNPENRKPEALPPGRQVAANIPAPTKSMRRPLMFALLLQAPGAIDCQQFYSKGNLRCRPQDAPGLAAKACLAAAAARRASRQPEWRPRTHQSKTIPNTRMRWPGETRLRASLRTRWCARLASHVTAFNHAFDNSTVLQAWSPWTAGGRAALDQVIQMQASIISYIDDFKLMMILSLAAIPLILLLRSAPSAEGSDHAMVMERAAFRRSPDLSEIWTRTRRLAHPTCSVSAAS